MMKKDKKKNNNKNKNQNKMNLKPNMRVPYLHSFQWNTHSTWKLLRSLTTPKNSNFHQLVKLWHPPIGRQRLEAELEVFLSLDHPHIARLLRATGMWIVNSWPRNSRNLAKFLERMMLLFLHKKDMVVLMIYVLSGLKDSLLVYRCCNFPRRIPIQEVLFRRFLSDLYKQWFFLGLRVTNREIWFLLWALALFWGRRLKRIWENVRQIEGSRRIGRRGLRIDPPRPPPRSMNLKKCLAWSWNAWKVPTACLPLVPFGAVWGEKMVVSGWQENPISEKLLKMMGIHTECLA